MLLTPKTGDLLLVDQRAYDRAEPSRGDIVVVRYSAGLVTKRIVSLPGEEVEVKYGRLYINSDLSKEGYQIDPEYLCVEKGKLLDEDFATLGDNRAVAPDLTIHPIVRKADILGKVVLALGKQIR
jgi:signal peptidase I